MGIEIRTEVDRQHSVDPSYIIRYQVFENGHFLGDGVAQYHRLAEKNDFRIPATIRKMDGTPLGSGLHNLIKDEINKAAKGYISSGGI